MKKVFFLVPLICVLAFLSFKKGELEELESLIGDLEKEAVACKGESDKQKNGLTTLQRADPFYLDKQIETLTFLEPEMKRLQVLASHQTSETIQARLEFLKSGKNRMTFIEEKRKKVGNFHEIEQRLQHPIEVNEEDLKKLLVLIEGVSIKPYTPKHDRPELFIQEFDLKKKSSISDEEVFVIDLKLMKREKAT